MSTIHTARYRVITACLDQDGAGLEYGPLNKPILRKDIWPNVLYVDHASTAELKVKYAENSNVPVDAIVDVDIVTNGSAITEFLTDNSFHFVVASHVAEHVPDLLGWLEKNLQILHVGGHISLAFPDRRYCFDFAKSSTSFHELISAYIEQRTSPTFTQICDQLMNSRKADTKQLWDGEMTLDGTKPILDTRTAVTLLRKNYAAAGYTDVHCWKYSDTEFLQMLSSARDVITVPYQVVSFLPTMYGTHEFFVTLQRL